MDPSSRKARWQQRAYLFGVTALAIAFAGSLGLRTISVRPSLFRATAVIEPQDGGAATESLAALRSRATSLPFLAEIGKKVDVSQAKDPAGGEVLRISVTDADNEHAITTANRAAGRLIAGDASSNSAARRLLNQARAATARAREQFAAEQQTMAKLVANPPQLPDDFIQPPADGNAASATPDPAPQATPVTPSLAVGETTNPAWEAAQRELAALEAKRTELLNSMTSEHPTIQRLDQSISEAIARLLAIPRTATGVAPNTPAPPTPTDVPKQAQQGPRLNPTIHDAAALESLRREQQQFAERLTIQMQAVRVAEARLNKCLADERTAAEALDQPPPPSPWRVIPAANAQRIAAAAPRWWDGLIATAAVIGGVLMGGYGEGRLAAIATRRDAERTLPIPVLGQVAPPDGSSRRSNAPRLAVRGIQRLCEATVVAAFIAIALSAIARLPG